MRAPNSFAVSLLISSLALSGCSLLGGKNVANQASSNGQTLLSGGAFQGTAGVKNVNQLLLSMTSVANISTASLASGGSNASISQQYATIAPFLSPDGSVNSINSAMLLSITGLAGQVCQAWAAQEATSLKVLAGTGISFGASGWNTQFTGSATMSSKVVNALANQFWGRPATSDEAAALVSAIQSAAGTVPDTGSMGVQDVLVVPCTIMLASPAFLLG